MVQVRGTVHDVSDNPERVERIVVRAVEPRMHGTTYITEESVSFPVVDGVLDFDVLPGPCVVAFLRNHGATTYEKLLVPDVEEATFRECLDAAALAEEGTKSALEKVVRQIQDELAKAAPLVDEMRTMRTDVSNDRIAVDGFAKAAKASASAAASSEAKAKTSETNAANSAASAKSQQESAKTHFNNTVAEAGKAADSAAAAKSSETKAATSASASASSAASSKTQSDKSTTSATQAGAARDAAKASETAAAGSAAAAKTSETAAKQSETNAGDYAAVATTAATESVAAMERATDLAGGDFATHEYVDSTVADALRSPRVLLHYGTGAPSLTNFPDARVDDVIERVSDGSRWKIEDKGALVRIAPEFQTLVPTSDWTGTVRAYRMQDRVILHLNEIAAKEDLSMGYARLLMNLPESLFSSGRTYAMISKRSSMASRMHVRVFGTMVHIVPINTGLGAGELIGDRIEYSLL